jgi:hypothetical protein
MFRIGSASDFDAEDPPRNEPTLTLSSVEPRGAASARTTTQGRRRPRVLSPQAKWEIFLQITAGEITQADAARKWEVDMSTIIGIRRTVKDAALAALAARPGRPSKERDWQLEAARAEIRPLTEAITAQAIELSVVRGKAGWG